VTAQVGGAAPGPDHVEDAIAHLGLAEGEPHGLGGRVGVP
jgi:hypothetical protein